MKCGDIYIGKCLSGYCPELWFYYVLLSKDREDDGKEYWAVATFMKGYYGAQINKYTDEEIEKLGYVGHILSVLTQNFKEFVR